MVINSLSFGSITIDGKMYGKDVIIDSGTVIKKIEGELKNREDN
jgi:hypothetical protein